jgi:HSP20 family protein
MRNRSLADPTREFEDIYQRMGQLMNAAFTDFALAPPGDAAWIPAAEESDTEDAYVVRVEVPGVRKDQLHVQVTDRELTITGEISETENGHRRRGEERYDPARDDRAESATRQGVPLQGAHRLRN